MPFLVKDDQASYAHDRYSYDRLRSRWGNLQQATCTGAHLVHLREDLQQLRAVGLPEELVHAPIPNQRRKQRAEVVPCVPTQSIQCYWRCRLLWC